MMGNCRFCRKQKELIEAHIIPNGIFKRTRGKGGPLEYITNWSGKEGNKSKGFIDSELLCHDCDNQFSKAENYLITYLNRYHSAPSTDFGKNTAFCSKDFDYEQFKLALLFMLWKSHITSLHEFANVRISSKSEKKLYNQLLEKSAGSRLDFPVAVRRVKSAQYGNIITKVILDPINTCDCTVEYLMLGWQFFICVLDECDFWPYGKLAIDHKFMTAIDFDIAGTAEEKDIVRLINRASECLPSNGT